MYIPVLSYHSISEDISYISLSTRIFEKQIIFLKKLGYVSINFNEIEFTQCRVFFSVSLSPIKT